MGCLLYKYYFLFLSYSLLRFTEKIKYDTNAAKKPSFFFNILNQNTFQNYHIDAQSSIKIRNLTILI
jgi:hypothetical protein